jgi:FlaA1/EpsC-like NDP-sugar epimerase
MNDFDGEIYLFGGHIFSQFLINRGLNISKIVSIIDNDTNKQGKRLYGIPLMVQSPYILRDKKNPAVILVAANYDHEIKIDIINNINKDTIFFTKKILYEQ